MRKSKLSLIVGAVLFLGVIAGIFFYSNVANEALSGFSVMSISQAQFVSKSSDLNYNDAYLINVVVNKGGEQLAGKITPEMITQYGIKYIPAGDFTISMNLKNVSCNYNVIDDNTLFFKIYQASARSGTIASNAAVPWDAVNLDSVKSACKGTWSAPKGTEVASLGAPIAGGDCNSLVDIQKTSIRPDVGAQASEWSYAMLPDNSNDGNHWRTTHVAGIPQYRGYKIDTVATPKFLVEIVVNNSKGEIQRTTLDETQTSQFLGDIGRVKFVGSLVAQEYCGVPAVEKNILQNLDSKAFTVVQRTIYDQYQGKLNDLLNYDNNYYAFQYIAPTPPPSRDPGVGADGLWGLMSSLNSNERILATTSITDACSLNNLIYSCKPSKDIIYPQMQLILKASWVGVILASGKPEITSTVIPDAAVFEGDVNYVKVGLKNTGLTDDSFDVNLKCDKPVTLGNLRTTLSVGETTYINLNYIGRTGEYLCTVSATSVNNPLMSDSKTLALSIKTKPLPDLNTCETVTAQPCDKALWQGYPVCDWNTQFCEQKSYGNLYLYIGIGIGVILALSYTLYYMNRKKSGRERRRKK